MSNILVQKNVLNEINKGAFTQSFKDCKKIKRKVAPKFLLIKIANCKASSKKAWPLHGFPFSLNSGDKPNDAQLELYYDIVTLKLTEDESQCQKKCYGYEHPSDEMYRACLRSSWTIQADIVVET